MGNDMAKVEVSRELIEQIIASKIETTIAAELGAQSNLLEQIVAKALTQKVDEKGEPSRYNYSSDMPYVSWLTQRAVRDAAKIAVEKFFVSQHGQLVEIVRRQLVKNKTQIADVLVSGLMNQAKNGLRFDLQIMVKKES